MFSPYAVVLKEIFLLVARDTTTKASMGHRAAGEFAKCETRWKHKDLSAYLTTPDHNKAFGLSRSSPPKNRRGVFIGSFL
jgi:hypothetical protein